MKRFLLLSLILIICFAFTACGTSGDALDPQSEEYKTIEIVSGSTGTSISELLVENGIISDAKAFKNYLKKNDYDSKLQAGIYTLSPNMDYSTICDVLIHGLVATKKFTLPEGLTCKQVANRLSEQGMGDYNAFMNAIENADFSEFPWLVISIDNNKYDRLEGYLLPNTYTIPTNYNEEQIIRFLLTQFEDMVVSQCKEMNVSDFNDVIVKASIIERESKIDDERSVVASVIENRLNIGMKLEMCSTVNYILLQEEGSVHDPLLYSDLEIVSPYNTYLVDGLPPHPICNPGIASISAALHPAETDFLYFVVSDELDGRNKFSSNYKDFTTDVSKYDKAKTEANKN